MKKFDTFDLVFVILTTLTLTSSFFILSNLDPGSRAKLEDQEPDNIVKITLENAPTGTEYSRTSKVKIMLNGNHYEILNHFGDHTRKTLYELASQIGVELGGTPLVENNYILIPVKGDVFEAGTYTNDNELKVTLKVIE